MTREQLTLGVAAFLDSPEAADLSARGLGSREDLRRIAEIFLAVCYEDLGKRPELLDGQELAEALARLLPARLGKRDPLAEHLPEVLASFLEHLVATRVVTQAFELRQALEQGRAEFERAVREGRHAHQRSPAPKPVVHQAPKLGRNDPCFCGSGQKFKKCHGRQA